MSLASSACSSSSDLFPSHRDICSVQSLRLHCTCFQLQPFSTNILERKMAKTKGTHCRLACFAYSALGLASVVHVAAGAVTCSEVSFHLTFNASLIQFSNPPDPSNETSVLQFTENADVAGGDAPSKGTVDVTGPFTMTGTYCTPTSIFDRNTLQVLVHGITYNKTMWFGLGYGDQYNWPAYAAAQGYHTLSINRLGHGTTHPRLDPTDVVQSPIQVELLHQLAIAIRTGHQSALPRTFGKIAYVGHSFGSLLAVTLAAKYPDDADALVLTGYSASLVFPWSGFPFEPVVSLFPQRYTTAPFGYLSVSSEAVREASFYAGDYDPRIPYGDFLYEDTVTSGELSTFGPTLGPASAYTKPVLLVTGGDDAVFCSTSLGRSFNDILNSTHAAIFPNVDHFSYRIISDTGHTLVLHRTSQTTFRETHDWLNGYFHCRGKAVFKHY
jgi:pimeloyl-ACP methyl ester carboxylesterase